VGTYMAHHMAHAGLHGAHVRAVCEGVCARDIKRRARRAFHGIISSCVLHGFVLFHGVMFICAFYYFMASNALKVFHGAHTRQIRRAILPRRARHRMHRAPK
jgi:hypothetical protein